MAACIKERTGMDAGMVAGMAAGTVAGTVAGAVLFTSMGNGAVLLDIAPF